MCLYYILEFLSPLFWASYNVEKTKSKKVPNWGPGNPEPKQFENSSDTGNYVIQNNIVAFRNLNDH